VKISVAKRTAALLGAVVFVLAAINTVNDQAVADSIPITNWSFDTTEVSIASGGDVYLTINGPIIQDSRYVLVDKLTFPGKQHQTIDTGIVVRDHIPAVDHTGFNVQAWVPRQVGSGYLFSTNGVFTYAQSGTKILFPRYGVFYGYSSRTPRDANNSAIRTVMSPGTDTDIFNDPQHTQENIAHSFEGFFSATLSNPSGLSFIEERNITPIGQSSPTHASTARIGKDPSFLGDTTLLIGGVGGPCLSATSCEPVWTTDAWYKTEKDADPSYHYYSASMFEGDITAFKIFGNTDGTNAIFDGIPAYDQVTGYCGFYDALSGQFKTAEPGYETLVTCSSQTPDISVTSIDDSPSLEFDYVTDPTQCSSVQTPVINPCLTSVDGVLRLALPPLPDGWSPGGHLFRLTISYGDVHRTIDFMLNYISSTPIGSLSIDKQAWKNVPVGTDWQEIVNGSCYQANEDHCVQLPQDSVIPIGSTVTFTFTVSYVLDDEWTGKPGLSEVIVTDDGDEVCKLTNVLVNTPIGCVMTKQVYE